MNDRSVTPELRQEIHSLTTYIGRAIASHPDDIRVEVDETDATTSVAISAHPDDMGRLIGRDGKTINAIRALVKVPVTKSRKKLVLTLLQG